MSYRSLRDFMARLEADGQLARVSEPVSTALEMTEIQTRLLAEGGPAVLFENAVHGDGRPAGMPVLVNLFGTVERVARAWLSARASAIATWCRKGSAPATRSWWTAASSCSSSKANERPASDG